MASKKENKAATAIEDNGSPPNDLVVDETFHARHHHHPRHHHHHPGDRPIRYKTFLHNTIGDVLKARGWVEVEDDSDWDFYWCKTSWMRKNFDHICLKEHQKICHFRNYYELTHKNLMAKYLKRLKKILEEKGSKVEAAKCDFFPITYELPSEYHIFVEAFKQLPGSIWIMKPVGKGEGKGIFLFRELKEIDAWKSEGFVHHSEVKDDKMPHKTYVVQQYIENPYLIEGKKFDIRVFVLVTSYIPLKVWLYRGGFARFSNTRFSLDSINDPLVHLTNVAIQKTAPDYDPRKGCKWSLQEFRHFLVAKHGPDVIRRLFLQIDEILIKTLQSVQHVIINDKHCFELYGFDILFDANLKPWLIEVNAAPRVVATNYNDFYFKVGLLEDMLHVVDMEGRLTGNEKRVGGFDLIWNEGPVASDEQALKCGQPLTYSTNSFLGCVNDREEQLMESFKIKPVQYQYNYDVFKF